MNEGSGRMESRILQVEESPDFVGTAKPRRVLLDSEDTKGLNMGLKAPVLRIFWQMLDSFYITGKRSFLMKFIPYYTYTVGFLFCALGFSAIFVIDMDIKRGTAMLMNPICGLQTVYKCWTFFQNTDEYLKLFGFLKKDFITSVPPEKAKAATIIKAENIKSTNQFIKYAIRWNLTALFIILVMPMIRSQAFREFTHLGEGPIIPNKVCETEYPFDWNYSPVYEIILLFEEMSVILAVALSSCYQAILLFLVMALVGHLKVLGFVMEDLKTTDFSSECCDNIGAVARAKAYKQLINCIKDHQKLMKAGDVLAERYNSFLTFHLGTAIIVGVIAIFNCTASEEASDKVKFAIMCVYGLLEVAIYCMCGQLLENASEDLLRQVYQCEWEHMEPKFRKAATLMMIRASNPLSLTAGKLYKVNLETLAAIQQLVYSALTMLSSMME